MITKEQAMTVRYFKHASAQNADGSALGCRANGKCQVWKTRPSEFKLPVKYGLKQCFYITNVNAHEWNAA